jgi:hypothetical protein
VARRPARRRDRCPDGIRRRNAAVGSAARLIEVYRTLHLPRFERAEDAAKMTVGLRAVGFEI